MTKKTLKIDVLKRQYSVICNSSTGIVLELTREYYEKILDSYPSIKDNFEKYYKE